MMLMFELMDELFLTFDEMFENYDEMMMKCRGGIGYELGAVIYLLMCMGLSKNGGHIISQDRWVLYKYFLTGKGDQPAIFGVLGPSWTNGQCTLA